MQAPDPERDEGAPLVLTSAEDVATLVRAHGRTFIVTNRVGDVSPAGARELGLFHDDTRYLSHYALSIAGHALTHLSTNAFDAAVSRIDLMVAGTDDQAFLEDPQNFLHVERQQLLDDAFCEHIELSNYLHRPITLEVRIGFDADFGDAFEIRGARRPRRGRSRAPEVGTDHVELAYDGLDGKRYATSVTFCPTPTTLDATSARFRLEIGPNGSASIDVCVKPNAADADADAPLTCAGFEGRARAERERAARFSDESTRFTCDDLVLQRVLEQSAADLRALSTGFDAGRVLVAGIPWFSCPFGRDTLLASYEALTLNPELARSSLRALAALQGTRFDEFTEEEPGKIFHELRFGEMAACKEIPHSPYYGTIDATPLFVVVLHATYMMTADLELVTELGEPLRRALAWIDRRSADGARLVTYERISPRGLDNQGWKDSRAGVSFPDGRRAAPPIALAEVQGYCIDAYRRGGILLAVLGDAEAAQTYERRARALVEVAERALWLDEHGRYALAVDGAGVAVPTIASNAGHLLWSRVPSPARARATAHLLVGAPSLSPFGIRTVAEGQPVYNPLSYHNGTVWPHDNALIAKGFANYDLMDEACAVFDAIVRAMDQFPDRRPPELYCGMDGGDVLIRYPVACSPQAWSAAAPFLLLQAILGLHVDGPHQRIMIRNPKLPAPVGRIELEGMRVGQSRVSLRIRREGKRCHVDRLEVSGPPVRTFVELE
jgi:glycogen debranching enzyme